MNKIKLVSVKDLSGFTFHIPYYQRGYIEKCRLFPAVLSRFTDPAG